MQQKPNVSARGRAVVWAIALVLATAGLLLAAMSVWYFGGSFQKSADANGKESSESASRSGPYPGFDRWRHSMFPGIVPTHICPGSQAHIDDDEAVIGVVSNGRARAYLCRAMERMDRHVVNDSLGNRPLTVTYCDVSDCAVAFTDDAVKEARLEVFAGGQHEKRLLMIVDGEHYFHDADDVPLKRVEVARRTWSQWKEEYPDTDVYVGEECQCAADASPTPQ